MTRVQAERELRRRIEAELPAPAVADRATVDAGARLLAHLEGLGRKRSTLHGYESFLRVHLAPYFGDRPLGRIGPGDVEAFIAASRAGVREVRFHDLRHTFGTRMAAAGVPMRIVQEWMGHRDFKTTLIYADYIPAAHEADLVDRAFAGRGPNLGAQPEQKCAQPR